MESKAKWPRELQTAKSRSSKKAVLEKPQLVRTRTTDEDEVFDAKAYLGVDDHDDELDSRGLSCDQWIWMRKSRASFCWRRAFSGER
ncbi:hypothetical protein HYC85_004675 [Camellia sinensis]|uniref:Uncharacterized protein n=1 Tax=Camellia sinensis TaxID=4442 RepID=A0A7J7HX69_CAMSI|nr:hypothetical protein HYC85_004675 [Camellia sinensis]